MTAYSYDEAGSPTADLPGPDGGLLLRRAGVQQPAAIAGPGAGLLSVYVDSTRGPQQRRHYDHGQRFGQPGVQLQRLLDHAPGQRLVRAGHGDRWWPPPTPARTVTVTYTGAARVTAGHAPGADLGHRLRFTPGRPGLDNGRLGQRFGSTTYDNLDRPMRDLAGPDRRPGVQRRRLQQSAAVARADADVRGLRQSPATQQRPYHRHRQLLRAESARSPIAAPSTTPLGSGWYELGTVTVAATDAERHSDASTYTGGGVTQVSRSWSKPRATVYDAGSATSLSHDRRPGPRYDLRLQQPGAADVKLGRTDRAAGLRARPASPTCRRRRAIPRGPSPIYVQASSAPSSGDTTITDSGTGTPDLHLQRSLRRRPWAAGGTNWARSALAASDTSSTMTVAYSGGGVTNVCVVQPMSGETYTPTGLVSSETSGNGNIGVSGYDAVYEPVTASQGQTAAFVSGSATLGNLVQCRARRGPTRFTCNRLRPPPAATPRSPTTTRAVRPSPSAALRRRPWAAAGTSWAQSCWRAPMPALR